MTWTDYLHHIRDEADFLAMTVANLSREAFLTDPLRQRACVRSLEIIGEAVKKLPAEVTARRPEIPWSQIARMRDRLIHGYFGVDYEIVWDTITTHVPALSAAVDVLLENATRRLPPGDIPPAGTSA